MAEYATEERIESVSLYAKNNNLWQKKDLLISVTQTEQYFQPSTVSCLHDRLCEAIHALYKLVDPNNHVGC